jgi:LptD protein
LLHKFTYQFLRNALLIVLYVPFLGILIAQNNIDTTKSIQKDTTVVSKVKTGFKDTVISKTKNVFDSRIKYTARDSMVLDNPNEMIYLYGLGTVNYETMDLKAGKIVINNKTKLVNAEYATDTLGNKIEKPAFNDGSQAFDSEKMSYNMDTKKGKIYEALTKQENLLVFGKAIKKDSSKIIYVKDAKCIPCEYADAQTYFLTKKAKIIPDDKVITGPVFLVLAGIPTPIGLPFGYFPSTRKKKSGVIIPKFRDAAIQGIGLAEGGFYWAASEYADVTITGDIYTSGSWRANIANRYLVNYKMQGSVNIAIARNYVTNGDLPGAVKPVDYSITWSHAFDQKFLKNARFSANVNYIGGLYNQLNQSNYNTTRDNNINSGISYSKTFKNFNISTSLTLRQNKTNSTVDVSFPQFSFALNPVKLFPNAPQNSPLQKLQFNYSNGFNATASTKENRLFSDSTFNVIKSGFQQNASLTHNQLFAKYFNISNAITLSGVAYLKTTRKNDITSIKGYEIEEKQVFDPKATVNVSYTTSINTTGIYGNYYYKSKFLKQIRHVMQPSVGFNFTPYLGDNFYNQNRTYFDFKTKEEVKYSVYESLLYGGPGTSKSGNVSFSLANTLDAKYKQKSDSGEAFKKASLLNLFNFSTSYNIFAKAFQWSPLNISVATNLFNKIGVSGGANYSFYGLDTGFKDVNKSAYATNNKLLTFKGANISFNTSFDKNYFLPKDDKEKGYEDFKWTLTPIFAIGWTPDYVNNKIKNELTTGLNGNLSLTKNWVFTFNTGYNFKEKVIVLSNVTIARDLRCWQLNINWYPNGPNRGYTIGLNLKNAMFQNFKIPRQRNWQDNGALQN